MVLSVSCAFHSIRQDIWAHESSFWKCSLHTFLHESNCTCCVEPSLSSAEPILNGMIGSNIQLLRLFSKPSESESHMKLTMWLYARLGHGQRHNVTGKVTCGHRNVSSAAAPDLALGMVEGGHRHC